MSDGTSQALLYRWGLLIARFRWIALLLPLALVLILVPPALQVTDRLSAGGWLPADADAVRVDNMLSHEFDRRTTSNYLLFSDPTGRLKAIDPEFRREVERIVKPLRTNPAISTVYTWGTTTNRDLNRILISDDGTMSLAVVSLRNNVTGATRDFRQFQEKASSSLLDIKIGGWPATTAALQNLTSSDLARAERISIPITLVLLILVYGGIVAATLPIALAGGSIVIALAALTFISHRMDSSIFAVNAVTMLGLAIGIDYALILISRYREELSHHDPETALAHTVATAGRAILVAGAAVTIGLAGLMVFAVPAAVSTGLAGATVVLTSVVLGLTSLPATLLILSRWLGTRPGYLDRLAPGLKRRFPESASRLLEVVHRHALASVVACAIVLGLLAVPLLSMRGSSPTMTVLPQSTEARQMYDEVADHFSHATLSPITVIVQPQQGRMTSSTNLGHLRDFTNVIAEMPGVTNVDSLWSFVPPGAGSLAFSASLTFDQNLQASTRSYVTSNAAVIQISLEGTSSVAEQEDFVRTLRAQGSALSGGIFTLLVSGESATSVDLVTVVKERAPLAAAVVILTTWIILFLQFQSILLPVKAIILNLLSLSASFGALVWIFQEGHLSGVLNFEPTGYTVVIVPILMFCFMFGLSMDYEVIMLSRIKEAWHATGDNDLAIRTGLHQSAGIVTSAAAVMLVVFAAFGTSELQIIKALGVGLGLAVLIDATIIRLILLPAAMQLMGKWNWWRPSLQRLQPSNPVIDEGGAP
ncbi:MAG: MMPL family transporter [Thermomicrobiales bacterium]